MRSLFSSQTLAEIFRDVYLNEMSGLMRLTSADQEKRIYVDRGMILFAESPVELESLGPCLVREGGISAGALIEAQRSIDGSTDARDLARALVHRDLVAKETLAHTVRLIVERVVRAVFQWESGLVRFDEGAQPPCGVEADVLSTIEVILQGVFSMARFEPIHEAMWSRDNRLRIRKPAPVPLERLTLSHAHGYILSRVDGNMNLKEVISILPPGEEQTASRLIFGLLVLGVFDYDPPVGQGPFKAEHILSDHADRQALETIQEQMIREAYAQVRQQSPHQILGIDHGASAEKIERAYEHVKSQLGREALLPAVRDRLRSELVVIESRLIEAFLTLTQPERSIDGARLADDRPAAKEEIEVDDLRVRVEMDKARNKVALEQATKVADAYYAKARKCMREGDYHNAIQYGKLAISYNPSDARYYFMLADCQARNPEGRWQRMAEENYTKATQLDPWNAEYWLNLGRFYRKRGLHIRARKQFEEALKLVPNSEAVLKELESLG